MTEFVSEYMAAAGVVLGVVLMLGGFRRYIIKDVWRNKKFRLSLSMVMIAAGTLMCLGAAAYMMFAGNGDAISVTNQPCITDEPSASDGVSSELPVQNEKSEAEGGADKETTIDESDSVNMCMVPDVVGMEQNEAAKVLTDCGLNFRVWWTEEHHVDSHYRYVASQSIPAGSSVPAGTEIMLELSVHKR